MSWVTEAINDRNKFRLHPLGFFFLISEKFESEKQRVHIWTEKLTLERQVKNESHMGNPPKNEWGLEVEFSRY